jgi:endogenous inhibitor of DNA gyrase (YacG/DUF329 family)
VFIRCPICRKELEVPDDHPSRPFCSPRCKKIDLGNWLDEKYRLPRPLLPEDLEGADLSELGLSEEELLGKLLERSGPGGKRSPD